LIVVLVPIDTKMTFFGLLVLLFYDQISRIIQ